MPAKDLTQIKVVMADLRREIVLATFRKSGLPINKTNNPDIKLEETTDEYHKKISSVVRAYLKKQQKDRKRAVRKRARERFKFRRLVYLVVVTVIPVVFVGLLAIIFYGWVR